MLSLLVLLCETRTGVKDLSLQSQSFPITDCPCFEKKDKFVHNIPPGQCDPNGVVYACITGSDNGCMAVLSPGLDIMVVIR